MIDRLISALLLILVVVGVWLVGFLVWTARTQADCLAMGYRRGKVTWSFGRYCIARDAGTDIVVPLREAYRRAVK